MQPLELSTDGQTLLGNLEAATRQQKPKSVDVLHISGVGGNLYFAYEQLRNAAEYSERHLLLRRAIERFLIRNVHLRAEKSEVGHELIAELTQARYLANDTVPRTSAGDIDAIVHRYLKLAKAVKVAHDVPGSHLSDWIFQTASVEIEHQLVEHALNDAFMDYVYGHYRKGVDRSAFEDAEDGTYDVALFCAVQRTLFKSDIATIRYYALAARLGSNGGSPLEYFVWLNESIDELAQSSLTNRIGRLVNRYGAPMRILREILLATNTPEKLLSSNSGLMDRVASESQNQYKLTRKRLNEGIIRSVIFIFITKILIGIAIEVPYDLVTLGVVAWLPLAINSLFPPLYMATIGWGIRTPGKRNTEVIQSYLTRILYKTDDPPVQYKIRRRVSSSTLTTTFDVIYAIGFLISFGVLVYILNAIGFTIVNGAIFFVFLSVVSFFGFRLLGAARELEIVDQQKSLISVALDFFYTPFIRAGNWLSDKYTRLNIVTFILDLAIELPLKTSLRVIQQWVGFIRDKQEEL